MSSKEPQAPDLDTLEDAEATFEDLAQVELDFEDLDTRMIAHQYILSKPLYKKRAAVIKKISNFWPLAFEMAPPDIDACIQPTDSEIFATSLADFSVDHFEIPTNASITSTDFGIPRSVSFKFEFLENEWFEDKIIEKRFYWRRSLDGFVGLVSEPVKIHWKSGKDLTNGLLDAAIHLSDAVKTKAGKDVDVSQLKESIELSKKVAKNTEGVQSFFSWFGYVGRFVDEKESKAAWDAFAEKRANATSGEGKVSEEPQNPDIMDNEIYPDGGELAAALANEFWPGALAYFTNAHDDGNDIDEDFEEYDDMEEDGDSEDDNPIDIRSLVKDDKRGDGPPAKKRRI